AACYFVVRIMVALGGAKAASISGALPDAKRQAPQSDWHLDGRPQAAERRVAERDVAAVGAGDVAGDGETEPGAALVLVARIVEAQKRLEHFLAHLQRDARPVVVDRHRKPAMIAVPGDGDGGGKARGVGDEIGQAALEGRRAHRHDRLAMEGDAGLVTV